MKTTFITFTAIGMLAASAAFSTGITAPTFERPKLIQPKNPDRFKANPDCKHKHISQDCDPEPREPECTMWKPGTLLATKQKECA